MREGISLAEARQAFLDDVGIALSPHTQRTYRTHLRNLDEWPTPQVCRRLLADEIRAGKSVKTVRLTAAALSSFGRWLTEQGYAAENPMRHVPYPRTPDPRPHRYLTRDELRRLWDACRRDRERLIMALLSVGLRAAEVLSIDVGDIADGLILVRGKGSKYRYVPLPPEAAPLLPESGLLVPVCYLTLWRTVQRLGKRAGIPRLHPHVLRHSFATHAVAELDIPTVQSVMGHARPELTAFYARSSYQRVAARKTASLRLLK